MKKRTKKIGGIFPKRIRKKGSEIIPVKKNEIILKRKQSALEMIISVYYQTWRCWKERNLSPKGSFPDATPPSLD